MSAMLSLPSDEAARRKFEYRIGGAVSFIVSLVLYILTVAPTTSFWDCGEFIACSYTMGIPHPPGAPMFIMLGRVFSLFPFFDVGLRVNMVSVFSSALTVLILYLIIVRLTYEWRGVPKNFGANMTIIAAALFGALTFAVTDTFWFNAVEAEVYSLSTLMTALVYWLALLWMDNHEDPTSVRFLITITYLFLLGACIHLLNLLVVPSILLIIWFTNRRVLLRSDLWTWSAVVAVLGFSAYLMIYIRSGMDPIIDQNNPETWANFQSYFRRDQYGTQSQFTTFLDRVAPFWQYQVKKMYLRYFGWQFIGTGTTLGADRFIVENLSFNGLMGIPFFAGLLGFVYHFRKDWRNALVLLVFFFMTGIAIVIYLNQPDPQPRERDYVYVGSYMAFCVWIGYGLLAILDKIIELLRDNRPVKRMALAGAVLIMTVIIPGNMLRVNYDSHDRSGLYLAWDYSYNILNSCEPNAILFTNGDNDTFPLWYLQEVEGIRQDVNIVNLSLVNTHWYILQLKNGARKVPVGMTDDQIKALTVYRLEKPLTAKLEVKADAVKKYMPEMAGLYPALGTRNETMEWEVQPTYGGQFLRVQDIMVLNILQANDFQRPIYFAITVSPTNFIGLRDYFRMDGLAYKILPIKGVAAHPQVLAKRLYEDFKFRCTNNPDVYYNLNNKTLLQNYRNGHINLAALMLQKGNQEEAAKALENMERLVPDWRVPIGNFPVTLQLAQMWAAAGVPDKGVTLMEDLLAQSANDPNQRFEIAKFFHVYARDFPRAISTLEELVSSVTGNNENAGQYIGYLLSVYESSGAIQQAIDMLQDWISTHPEDAGANAKMQTLQQKLAQADSSSIQ